MPRTAGEMPFLDHLEELRSRILRSLLAIVACFAVGLWLVNRFRLIDLIKKPIAQFLPNGQLTVLSPTEPLMIVLKLALIVGLVLASPILLWQLWAFLSPALYEKEKKTLVPSLFVGLGLFLAGGSLAFMFIVPQALRVLMGVQSGTFNPMITYDAYFSFVMQIVLALGLSCELPLLMIILAALGIVATPMLNKIRPYAIVGSFVLGAVLSPGADVLSMFMLTIPLLLLYEIGVAGVWMVQKRRKKAEAAAGAALILLLCLIPVRGHAQQPFPPPPVRPPGQPGRPVLPGQGRDTVPQAAGTARKLDSASARRLGLPSAPRMSFNAPDSIMSQLLDLEGYEVTRYRSDSATVKTEDKEVHLRGNAMTNRSGAVVEAAAIKYRGGDCGVDATGEPHMFQNGQVLIGESARFDTCKERGVIRDALTQLSEGAGNWFIRGNLAIDQNQGRLYGGNANLTSCDLPIPHYHFAAKEMKWVSKSVMVARPAVLYIRDVPVAWIPFIFQDTKTGRHSGILIPQFGFNDIVRPTNSYNRQVTNIGYYWAPNDYFDAQLQLDWFNNRYLQWGVTTNYRLLKRFVTGQLLYSVQNQSGGGTGKQVSWFHTQTFNVSTSLSINANYATNTSILSRNSIDPRQTTQQISSGARFTKRYSWGSVDLGMTAHQNVNDGSATLTAPTFTISPKSLDIGRHLTWSPSFSFTNNNNYKTPAGFLFVPGAAGGLDSTKILNHTRASAVSIQTPLRIGSFNWVNSVTIDDVDSTGRFTSVIRVPNPATSDPNDSISVSQFRNGGFGTAIGWETGINLPILFAPTWKLTPNISIANSASGLPFAIRNARTGGGFVMQGKRLSFGASISPTFFAFFGGFAGISRIRHSISPSLSWTYAPAGNIPAEYARAIGKPNLRKTIASQTVQLTLNQNFEAKGRQAATDTTGANVRKFRLLSITTSSIAFDIEKSKQPGQTGWTTQSLSNTLASDLLPGFSFSMSHNLWDGLVGLSSSKFKPFLESVNAGFSITGRTFQSLGSIFGLAKRPGADTSTQRQTQLGMGGVALPGDVRRSLLNPNQRYTRGSLPFNSTINISIARTRPTLGPNGLPQASTNRSSVGFNTSFSPTKFWGVTWATQYNVTDGKFESQQISLSRDLHEWRAAFNFQKSPNGNFSFLFSVFLTDFTAIKFDYNQTTFPP